MALTESQWPAERFANELARLNLPVGATRRAVLAERLADYTRCLHADSRPLGLISAADSEPIDRLVRRHVLDSIAPAALICAAGPALRIADLGSGAGLPGIPLALLGREVIAGALLVERKAKRARFLERIVARFELPARVHDRDLRELTLTEPVDAIVFRAFHGVDRDLLKRLRAVFGRAVPVWAYKGTHARADAQAALLRELGTVAEVIPLVVPGLDEQRCLLRFTT